jgi:hypothetical protein
VDLFDSGLTSAAPSDCMRASPAIKVQGPSSDLGRRRKRKSRVGRGERKRVGKREDGVGRERRWGGKRGDGVGGERRWGGKRAWDGWRVRWHGVVSFHSELILEISADDAVAAEAEVEVEAAPASCGVTYLYASWPAMTATFPLRIKEQLEERNGGCCYRGQNRG